MKLPDEWVYLLNDQPLSDGSPEESIIYCHIKAEYIHFLTSGKYCVYQHKRKTTLCPTDRWEMTHHWNCFIIEVKCQWIIFPVLCIFLWLIDCLCPCLINFKVFYTLTKLMVALCITQFPPIHNFFKVLFFAFFAIQNLELVLNKAYHFLYSFLILLIIFPVLLCFLSHI